MYILLGRELGREHEAGDGEILVGFQMGTDGRGVTELTRSRIVFRSELGH